MIKLRYTRLSQDQPASGWQNQDPDQAVWNQRGVYFPLFNFVLSEMNDIFFKNHRKCKFLGCFHFSQFLVSW